MGEPAGTLAKNCPRGKFTPQKKPLRISKGKLSKGPEKRGTQRRGNPKGNGGDPKKKNPNRETWAFH